jgi:UTP:GlnB (protein PII) uridylyltransferase
MLRMNRRRNVTVPVTPHSEGAVGHEASSDDEPRQHPVEDFIASMPERYGQEFDAVSARQHACIAVARGRRPVHVDRFAGNSAAGPGLCVVGGDGPGLLAAVCAALVLERFDITRADVYTRRSTSFDFEAVDLFWVRRACAKRAGPICDEDVSALRSTLRELLTCGDARRRLQYAVSARSPRVGETKVGFRNVRGAPWLTLELEGDDRPGLLAVVTGALAGERTQIVDGRIRTHGLRVHDYFDLLESDGTRLAGARLQRLERVVLAAIDGPEPDPWQPLYPLRGRIG